MAKHTKGPWKIYEDDSGNNGYSDYIIVAGKDDFVQVGRVWFTGDDDESRANAHLIAAADDLLAACKDTLLALTLLVEHKGAQHDDVTDIYDWLETAIAKAESDA